jgi:hypothetical protein
MRSMGFAPTENFECRYSSDRHKICIMKYEVRTHTPGELSKTDIANCLSIIKDGDAVDYSSAAKQLPLAKLIAVVRAEKEIVGVAAVKNPRSAYASGIGKKSQFPFEKNMLEVGYVARRDSHRGHNLSQLLVTALTTAIPGVPLFATTSNETMKKTLKAAGFVRRGKEWTSKGKYDLSLWLKQTAK